MEEDPPRQGGESTRTSQMPLRAKGKRQAEQRRLSAWDHFVAHGNIKGNIQHTAIHWRLSESFVRHSRPRCSLSNWATSSVGISGEKYKSSTTRVEAKIKEAGSSWSPVPSELQTTSGGLAYPEPIRALWHTSKYQSSVSSTTAQIRYEVYTLRQRSISRCNRSWGSLEHLRFFSTNGLPCIFLRLNWGWVQCVKASC